MLDEIRSVRIFGSAVFDWTASYLAAYAVARYAPQLVYGTLAFRSPLQFYASIVPLAVAAHLLSGTRTHMIEELDNPDLNIFKVIFWLAIVVVFSEALRVSHGPAAI